MQESEPDVADEGEVGASVGTGEVVEEDAADAARLAAVGQPEVLVAPSLEAGPMVRIGSIAGSAQRAMEGGRVLRHRKYRR